LILYYDKVVKYANIKFANVLYSYSKIIRSISGKGNYRDNAVAENFYKSLKTELLENSITLALLKL
jgi:transposase InsO family protein